MTLESLRQNGYSPKHHEVHLLALHVLVVCNGPTVADHLDAVCKRVGFPVQIVSDHGSDVRAGIASFVEKQADPRRIVATHDITHGLAILLKNRLEPDQRWGNFVKACQSTRQQLQQTAGSFLRPPAWRSKSRFLNLESHLKWAQNMLTVLEREGQSALAIHLGKSEAESRAWLEEKLGWLREYKEDVRLWNDYQKVVKGALEEVKENGLSRTSWKRCQKRMAARRREGKEKTFLRQVVSFVRREGAKVPAGEKYLGSSDVLESLFGSYKDLAEKSPCREITANVLTIPLLVTTLTAELLGQALESVRAADVEQWLDDRLGPSPQKKKREVLTGVVSSGKHSNRGPKPA